MEVKASAKFVRMSPKKVRPLLATLRGMKTQEALLRLKHHRSKSAKLVYKLVHSAVSNAKNNYNFKEDNLKIKAIAVDDGPTFKRYWFRSRGSADQLLKRTSHISVTLVEIVPSLIKKPVAKPVATPKAIPAKDDKNPDTPSSPSAPKLDDAAKPAKTNALKKIFNRRTTNK